MDGEEVRRKYFDHGTYYYAAGRFQVLAGLSTAGVSLHHAIEMYLKGYLSEWHSEEERKSLRHRLKRLWKLSKEHAKDSTLVPFDSVISTLDRFERIRYPERLVRLGGEITMNVVTPTGPNVSTGPGGKPLSLPKYALYLDAIDKLVAKIFEFSSVNHRFPSVRSEARTFLNRHNSSLQW